jgi:hypothetical protein
MATAEIIVIIKRFYSARFSTEWTQVETHIHEYD